MSFFLESERNTAFQGKNTPAPGEYNIQVTKKKAYSCAPFNSTSKLFRGNKEESRQEKERALDLEKANNQLIDENKLRYLAQNKQVRQNSMFVSRSQRFISNRHLNPGPGSYNLRGKPGKQLKLRASVDKQQRSRLYKQMLKKTTPSVPTDNLGYRQNNIRQMQKVEPQKSFGAYPGAYQIRKQLFIDHGCKWQPEQSMKKIPDNVGPGPGSYPVNSRPSKRRNVTAFASKTDRFGVIRSIKNHINPGPGSYITETINKMNRSASEGHFNTKAKRFQQVKKEGPDPGAYFGKEKLNLQNATKKNIGSFNSSEQKKSSIEQHVERNKVPGPGQYTNLLDMNHQLQLSMIRKFNPSQFPNARREVFNDNRDYQIPGPGQYDPERPQLNVKCGVRYKPTEVINLREEVSGVNSPAPADTHYKNFTIGDKASQCVNKLTLTERKPFGIGSDRFRHYKNGGSTIGVTNMKTRHTEQNEKNQRPYSLQQQGFDDLQQMNRKVKKLVMTTLKVKVPFGISSSKYTEKETIQPGPGDYDSNSAWVKKTFNIKGRLDKNQ